MFSGAWSSGSLKELSNSDHFELFITTKKTEATSIFEVFSHRAPTRNTCFKMPNSMYISGKSAEETSQNSNFLKYLSLK